MLTPPQINRYVMMVLFFVPLCAIALYEAELDPAKNRWVRDLFAHPDEGGEDTPEFENPGVHAEDAAKGLAISRVPFEELVRAFPDTTRVGDLFLCVGEGMADLDVGWIVERGADAERDRGDEGADQGIEGAVAGETVRRLAHRLDASPVELLYPPYYLPTVLVYNDECVVLYKCCKTCRWCAVRTYWRARYSIPSIWPCSGGRTSWVRTPMERTKNGRISLISMAQRFGSYGTTGRLSVHTRRHGRRDTHTQLAVVDFGDTFSTL